MITKMFRKQNTNTITLTKEQLADVLKPSKQFRGDFPNPIPESLKHFTMTNCIVGDISELKFGGE